MAHILWKSDRKRSIELALAAKEHIGKDTVPNRAVAREIEDWLYNSPGPMGKKPSK